MKIIFLDIDGVLNSNEVYEDWHLRTGKNGWGGFFPEDEKATDDNVKWGRPLVENLKKIVEATEAKIVICSTWRKHFTVEKFKEMFLVYGWDAPVVDKTPTAGYRIRGMEVKKWIDSFPTKLFSYVILDDYNDFMVDQQPYYVETNPEVGLSDSDADKAISILNKTIVYGEIQKD